MQYVVGALILVALVWFVTVPLRRSAAGDDAGAERADARVAEIELRKEAKYREIRDAQLDHAAGKLSEDDFAAMDAALRREAVGILEELDRAQAERGRGRG